MPKTFAIVPAAGSGSRLGGDVPKQYLEIGGRSLLERSVAPLLAAAWIDEVLVIVAPGDRRAAQRLGAHPRLRVSAVGGATRRDTVLNAIATIAGAEDDWVVVHDAARPGLDAAALERLRAALASSAVGGLLALPVADTLKRAGPGGGRNPAIAATIEREGIWLAQTPQMFRLGLLRDALAAAPLATDESSAVEALGHHPLLVPGSWRNFKVTTSDDLAAMRQLLDKE